MKLEEVEGTEQYESTKPYMMLANTVSLDTLKRFHKALAQAGVVRGVLLPDESFIFEYEWVAVADRLPEIEAGEADVEVLCFDGVNMFTGCYSGGRAIVSCADFYTAPVMHWHPLPEIPKEGAPQGTCSISGADGVDFQLDTIPEARLQEIAQYIWDNPGKHSDYAIGSSDDAYYRFLKYLWVKYPDGQEKRLADIIE